MQPLQYLRDLLLRREPVMGAALVAGAISLAGHFGFHLNGAALAIVGAVSVLLLNTIARRKVGSPNTMADLIEQINAKLGVPVAYDADGNAIVSVGAPGTTTIVVPPPPSVRGEAAAGGAMGGAAGAAAGGAVGSAVGSVLGAVTGAFNSILGRDKEGEK